MEARIRALLDGKGSEVMTTAPDATVLAAVSLMNEKHIGALVVVDRGGEPIGMFTERDVLQRIVGASRDPNATAVRDVMTKRLIVVSPDITVNEAMRVVTERRCRHLPVVEGGKLIGLISSGDLTRWVIGDQAREISDLFSYMHGPYYDAELDKDG